MVKFDSTFKTKVMMIVVENYKSRLIQVLHFTAKTVRAWGNGGNIQDAHFRKVITDLGEDRWRKIFGELTTQLVQERISKESIEQITLNENLSITDKLEKIQSYVGTQTYLQNSLGHQNIIQLFVMISKQYLDEYVNYYEHDKVSFKGTFETAIRNCHANDAREMLSKVVIRNPAGESVNFMRLGIGDYNVGILLSNYNFANSVSVYKECFSILEKVFNLHMVIVFTDISGETIPYEIQKDLMQEKNVVFKFITPANMTDSRIINYRVTSINADEMQTEIRRYRYAQQIFQLFAAHLSVVSTDMIYKQATTYDLKANLVKRLQAVEGAAAKFNNFAKEIFVKDVCAYSYLPRHAIYYERTLVARTVEEMFSRDDINCLQRVVEISATNSLITSNIVSVCKELVLFTSSSYAYQYMTKLIEAEGESDKVLEELFPQCVSVELCPLDAEIMQREYAEILVGKVDLLVIGYGVASQISDLFSFLRNASTWLSDRGVLFISGYNSQSLIIDRFQLNKSNSFGFPVNLSDYWSFIPHLNRRAPFLAVINTYTREDLIGTCKQFFDVDNEVFSYPFISALVNPDEYSKSIIEGLREADKKNAASSAYGVLVDIIARKQTRKETNNQRIQKLLTSCRIKGPQIIKHGVATDADSLMNSIDRKNLIDTVLMRTTILWKKEKRKNDNVNGKIVEEPANWICVILPYGERIGYCRNDYKLASEKEVRKFFGDGVISPLDVCSRVLIKEIETKQVIMLGDINANNIILGSGKNSECYKFTKDEFIKILDQTGVTRDASNQYGIELASSNEKL